MGLINGLKISYKKDTDVLSNIWISKILYFFLKLKYTGPTDKSLGQPEMHKSFYLKIWNKKEPSFDVVLSNTQQYKNITNDVGQHILDEISNSGSFLPTDGPELDKILKTFFFMPHFHPIAD